ncbi:SIMPL domain-containing protein [Herminiimonas sp. CN]|uniref:SIMPL domain-containing protein n=1 Tax=Herminiimonas sp. CN TaxID=1349818 RepID=UPI000473C1A6|nr:SIMPL domain-containing protein [Herminiimonas sp. CN]
MKKICAAAALLCAISGGVLAQQVATAGTLVTVSAAGEVRAGNNEARALFFIEEQDKDKAAAASRVNQKMRQGVDVLKKEDPQATLASRNYYTYPVYEEERPQTGANARKRQLTGWRVGQYLDMKTENLQKLPATVAAAQNVLALNGVTFGLSEALGKRLDAARITDAYQNLMMRVQVIAKAMGRNATDAIIETVDFDSVDNPARPYMAASMLEKSARMDAQVVEASFEPGESTLVTRVVAHVRFK